MYAAHAAAAAGQNPLGNIEVTPEWETLARAVAAESYQQWKANVTPEARARAEAEHAKYLSGDQEYISGKMASLNALFVESDANGDGRLNFDEYNVFEAGLIEQSKADGTFVEPRADHTQRTWEVYSGVNPAEEGFSYAEWLGAAGKFMAYYKEC